MQFQLPLTLPGGMPGAVCTFASIAVAIILFPELSNYRKLSRIPTLGPRSLLISWLRSHKFNASVYQLIQEGYEKYNSKGLLFKIANSYRWLVLIGYPKHIEEFEKAPDDVFSFMEASNELVHTLGREAVSNPYQNIIIRGQLTRNIGSLYPEVLDEISVAFDEYIHLGGDEWKAVPAAETIEKVVCRTTNRVFVGLPLCRDPGWINIVLRYTLDIVEGGNKIRHLPDFLAPFVIRFITDVPKAKKHAMKHLAPIIEERLRFSEEHGNGLNGRPNDLLSWLMDEAPEGPERTVRLLTERVLIVNFVAIHTTSNAFTITLFSLAENPQYVQPLREEVEGIIEKEGWSKASLSKMRKIDSFIKEVQRFAGSGLFGVARMAMKDFVFSDGTLIPKGTLVAPTSANLHLDDQYYGDARVFKPFRFSDMREGREGTKHQFVSTSPEHLTFGHGRHACPGRFFAANTLKTMLAHVLITYDVKLEDNKARPEGIRVAAGTSADPFAKVMFRRRTY